MARKELSWRIMDFNFLIKGNSILLPINAALLCLVNDAFLLFFDWALNGVLSYITRVVL